MEEVGVKERWKRLARTDERGDGEEVEALCDW